MPACVNLRLATNAEISSLQATLSSDPDQSIGLVSFGTPMLMEEVYLVERSGEAVGFCTYRGGSGELFALVIFSPYRDEGLGFAAARQLVELLRSRGVLEISLMVINDAGPFWSKVFAGCSVTPVGDDTFSVDISHKP